MCISGLDSYSCKCQGGYTGKNCQIDIDDCAATPCQNGGSCVDGLKSYSCQCPTGYSGVNCEHAIDRCVGQPCQNGGTCVKTPTGFKCTCMPSYYKCLCNQGGVINLCNSLINDKSVFEALKNGRRELVIYRVSLRLDTRI